MKLFLNAIGFKNVNFVCVFLLSIACLTLAGNAFALDSPYLCEGKKCTVAPDPAAATDKHDVLVDFAHTTDIHIVDEGNPIRAEELKVEKAKNPDVFADLFKKISSANRPIGPYTALLWEYFIKDLNSANALDPLDFMIATGDFSDTSILPEYQLFVDLIDGEISTPLKEHCDCRGIEGCECDDEPATDLPANPQGLDTVFYATMGNHDIEYMGSFHTDGFIGLLVKELASGIDLSEMAYIDSLIDIFQNSKKCGNFGNMMDEASSSTGKVKGAYSFNPSGRPFVHCIVLNTCEYTYEKNGKEKALENFSLGALSNEQMTWMLNDIDANRDKLCIIFAHHGPHWFWPIISKNDKFYVTGSEVKDALKTRNNVIAWVNGHSHMNKIRAEYNGDGTGYWDINTSGIIEYPYEWRRITIRDLGTGMGVIKCEMKKPADLDKNVPEIEAEGDDLKNGKDDDRNIELYFKMPIEVAQAIKTTVKPQEAPGINVVPTEDPGNSDSESSSGMCFMTSALI